MKKIVSLTSALVLSTSYPAYAQVNVNIGTPIAPTPVYESGYLSPGYVMRPDWPSNHYDYHRYHHDDYWARRNREEHRHFEYEHHEHEMHEQHQDEHHHW